MDLSTPQWHRRYLQQALWTKELRAHLYHKLGVQDACRILDIGCGTGVLERELNELYKSLVFGVDINLQTLKFARGYAPKTGYTAGDGLQIPFASDTFDITMCHFLLLWIKDTCGLVREMARVTRSNGYVLALAEPDYGGRIDYPAELAQIGRWQSTALTNQGADPTMGRKLRSTFSRAGLLDIEAGVLGGQWLQDNDSGDAEQEWEVISSDLGNNEEFLINEASLMALDKASRQAGERILFVPTFYAIGRVPG